MARLVIAFGGNALIREDERGTWPEQTVHALEAARAIARMGRADEVGAHPRQRPAGRRPARCSRRSASRRRPALPLDSLVADTQGEIGYMIEHALPPLTRRCRPRPC